MITVTASGRIEGIEPSKSHPGYNMLYMKNTATPPADLLRAVNCPKKFGAPEQAQQQIGNLAILCPEAKIPTFEFGARIALTANLWTVAKPIFSTRQNKIVISGETISRFTLAGDIKTTKEKPAPYHMNLSGYFLGAKPSRDFPGLIAITVQTEAETPAAMLLKVNVKTQKGAPLPGNESAANPTIYAKPEHIGPIAIGSRFTVDGLLWPIMRPYYNEQENAVTYAVIPDIAIFTTAPINADKVKASA